MDRQGVDLQVIAIPPPNFHYHVPAPVGSDFARIQNDHLIALSASQPDRLHVFATLPLQDVGTALAELDRIAVEPRVRGVQIGTNIDGVDLDDSRWETIWEALEERGLAVWLHPDQRSIAGSDRLARYYLQNLIGNPLESTIAMARLIFGGVVERHSRLRFGFVHGGGFSPYQIGRWDHGWGCRSEPRQVIGATPPGEYLRRFYFDSLTHDPLSLDLLGRRVGWDHVVLGSDYPFDMASADPVGAVDQLSLAAGERKALLEDNAHRFLRPLPEGKG
jgi:aminocarboxymuconate-semialdehyde decarboxylase